MTLDKIPCGQCVRICRVCGAGAIRRRLMDMGLVKGVSIEVLRSAPLGDPIAYRLRGYQLALRKSEAQLIEVEA
jgi:ferrous iron transport protein A